MADSELVMLKFDCLNHIFDKLYDLFKKQAAQYNLEGTYKKGLIYKDLVYLRYQIFNEYDRLRNIWKIIDDKWRDAIRGDISQMCVQTNYGLDYGVNLYINKRSSSEPKSRLDIRILAVHDAIVKLTSV